MVKNYKKLLYRYKLDFLYSSHYYYNIIIKLISNKKKIKKKTNILILKLFFFFKYNNNYNIRNLNNWKLHFFFIFLHNYLSPSGSLKVLRWYKYTKKKKILQTKFLPSILSVKKKYKMSSLWFQLEVRKNTSISIINKIKEELFKVFNFKSRAILTKLRFHAEVKHTKFKRFKFSNKDSKKNQDFEDLKSYNTKYKLNYKELYLNVFSKKQLNLYTEKRKKDLIKIIKKKKEIKIEEKKNRIFNGKVLFKSNNFKLFYLTKLKEKNVRIIRKKKIFNKK